MVEEEAAPEGIKIVKKREMNKSSTLSREETLAFEDEGRKNRRKSIDVKHHSKETESSEREEEEIDPGRIGVEGETSHGKKSKKGVIGNDEGSSSAPEKRENENEDLVEAKVRKRKKKQHKKKGKYESEQSESVATNDKVSTGSVKVREKRTRMEEREEGEERECEKSETDNVDEVEDIDCTEIVTIQNTPQVPENSEFIEEKKKKKKKKGNIEDVGDMEKSKHSEEKNKKRDGDSDAIGEKKSKYAEEKKKKKKKGDSRAVGEMENSKLIEGKKKKKGDLGAVGETENSEFIEEKKKKKGDSGAVGETEISEFIEEKKKKKGKGDLGAVSEDKSLPTDDGDSRGKNTELTGNDINRGGSKKKRANPTDSSEISPSKGSPKKVRFSSHVEVFPISDHPARKGPARGRKKNSKDGLIHGKRFSKEEDDLIRDAVSNYIEVHHLGEDGLNKVLNCKHHPEIRNCWKEIAKALPWRPQDAVYYRGHIIFERGETYRKWTPEELKLIRKVHQQRGADWKTLAIELGKHRFHVKDAWRRTRHLNAKKGHWSQDEYQTLFDLVNVDLRIKAFEEKKTKHGMLRDNISWEAVSDKLTTRSGAYCCLKWYGQLSSPMVAEGNWADADDYRLLDALVNVDASCEEDVEWDYLLEHRSGDLCRKRWGQMVRHIGQYGTKSFAEQVEILANRYCPDLLEAREAYESREPVDD